MQNLIPMALDIFGAIAKEAALEHVRSGASKPAATRIGLSGDTPPGPKGCPYCASAKGLAIAFRYLARAKRSPATQALYIELARKAVRGGMDELDAIQTAPDHETISLAQQMTQIEVRLSRPVGAAEIDGIAKEVWEVSDVALDLAERYNSADGIGDRLASMVDRKLAAQASIIEGSAVELPA